MCLGLASTRIRGDVQCTRLRLTLARRLKRGRWLAQGGLGSGGPLEEGLSGWRRSVCSRAMNYAVRRGLGPRRRGKKMEKDCRTANQPARNWERDDVYLHGPEPLYPPHPSLRRVPSPFSSPSPPVPPPELLSTTTIHLPPSPTPPPRRSRAPPTLRSSRLKFSYRHVYRPSLCFEQVKCTATVVASSFRHAIFLLPSLSRTNNREVVSLPSSAWPPWFFSMKEKFERKDSISHAGR